VLVDSFDGFLMESRKKSMKKAEASVVEKEREKRKKKKGKEEEIVNKG
jgi:hypothetical protein